MADEDNLVVLLADPRATSGVGSPNFVGESCRKKQRVLLLIRKHARPCNQTAFYTSPSDRRQQQSLAGRRRSHRHRNTGTKPMRPHYFSLVLAFSPHGEKWIRRPPVQSDKELSFLALPLMASLLLLWPIHENDADAVALPPFF